MCLNGITLAAVLKRLKVEKAGSRETSLEVIEIFQAREDGGLSQAGNSGDGEKRLISGYVLKVEPTGLAE